MFYEEIRRQAEAAPRAALPAVTAALWRAYGEGRVTEAEAEALSAVIEIQLTTITNAVAPNRNGRVQSGNAAQNRAGAPRGLGVGSRPRTDASIERRRRWAASGRLPPGLAARFTLAEQAVLALVAAETARRGDCRLAVGHLAAIAGLSETTVRNAIREARQLGLVTVEERRVTGFRNLPNIVRIVLAEWTAWLRLTRKGGATTALPSPKHHRHGDTHPSLAPGGGCKSTKGTPTEVQHLMDSRPADPKKSCRRAAGDIDRSAQPGIRADRGADRAMR